MDKRQGMLDLEGGSTHTPQPNEFQQHQPNRKKKVKVYDDDTTSYEGLALTADDEMRREARARRHAFRKFIAQNKKVWLKFNIVVFLLSLGFLITNFFVGQINQYVSDGADCGNLSAVRYIDYVLHSGNVIITLVNIKGSHVHLCHANLILGVFLFEFILLGWKQLIYFQAQTDSCMYEAPWLYWWQFVQLLTLYVAQIYLLCSFMRRYFPTDEPGTEHTEEWYVQKATEEQQQMGPTDNYNLMDDLNNQAHYRFDKNVKENVHIDMNPQVSIPVSLNPQASGLASGLGNSIKLNVKLGQ